MSLWQNDLIGAWQAFATRMSCRKRKAWHARVALCLLIAALTGLAQQRPQPLPPPRSTARVEAIRRNNLGAAYMNQQNMARALASFRQAYALDPKLLAARLNQGIALLNMQKQEDARKILSEIAARDPKNIRAWFHLGLLERNAGQLEPALAAFQRAAELDPDDADLHYFVGLLHSQLQSTEPAVAEFSQALQRNPFHVSAEFGLARIYHRTGASEKAAAHLARFQKLTQEKLGAPIDTFYGSQGRYSVAEQVALPGVAIARAIPVQFVFVPASQSGLASPQAPLPSATDLGSKNGWEGSGACFLDYDADGRTDLWLLNAGGTASPVLYRNVGGRFADVTTQVGIDPKGQWTACVAGDYDNDGHTDLASIVDNKVVFLRNSGKGQFLDATPTLGIRADDTTGSLLFLDYDHDGDLDLYVTRCAVGVQRESGPHNVLWRNNGNGRFTDWTEPTGLGGTSANASAVSADFNNDRAIDLLVTQTSAQQQAAPPILLLNPREGHFQQVRPWTSRGSTGTHAAAVFDFNKDGWMDVAFAHADAPGFTLWRNVNGTKFEQQQLPGAFSEQGLRTSAVLDYDNDGWLDLAIAAETRPGEATLLVLRNEGTAGFRNVSAEVGAKRVKLRHPRAMAAVDSDGDGDADLLITQQGAPPVLLRNDGGNSNNWIKLSLEGLADNKSAVGTKVEIFAGSVYQKFEVSSSSHLGQNAADLLVGLGGEKEVDIVRLLWPTGVLQDEIQLAVNKRHAIGEIDRRGSSCPVLFAWDGKQFGFITDAIGPGIVGHWVAPGQRNTPDPTEYIKVEGQRLQPRHGRLSFRFAEPMEEIIYLDQVKLFAVDHPGDVAVYPNERFAAAPPFPEFKVIASRGARVPEGAWDHKGRDVRALLERRDRRYVGDFLPLPYKGFVEPHSLEIDLGIIHPAAPLRLLLHGLTDYFTATSVYAAHQAGVTAIVPYVEALDTAGRWVRVVDDMGFPAGLARTMVADLTGRLPAGTRRIRIVTNLRIYWDQILIDNTPEGKHFALAEVPLQSAALSFRGYPREVRGNPPGDIRYVYEDVSLTGPYARPAGNLTRYGDVQALLEASDDRFAIFATGEEVALEFDPSRLPSLPPGWRRDYFFYIDGFAKDMDFYAAHGDTVDPLPFHRMEHYPYLEKQARPMSREFLKYQLDANTRAVSGAPGGLLRFAYP